MPQKSFAPGQASSISRGEFAYIGIACGTAVGNSIAFNFPFAGGWIGGTAGTYQVYVSADNGATDPYEPLKEDGSIVEVVVEASAKTIIPSAMYNVGWAKLVGVSGSVNIVGTG